METIVVQASSIAELKMIEEFLKKNKLKSRVLTEDDKVDIVLGKLMEETDYNKTTHTGTFIKKLRS
jgi:hypothetical protein